MTEPKRIQLRRTKGWRKPEGAIVVARPSRWGNPYKPADFGPGGATRETLVHYFRAHVEDGAGWNRSDYPSLEEIRSELAGRDLACWCPLNEPCHADVLLELANGGVS